MQNNDCLALTLFVVIWTVAQMAYMHHVQTTFVLNNEAYDQIGVMQYNTEGKEVYIPIYRRTLRK